jgi:hypothetical protein
LNRNCKTCLSPSLGEIEKLLAVGGKAAPLARRFELSPDSVRRHWASHVTKERIAELQGRSIFGRDAINPQMLAQLRDEEADRLILRLVWVRAEAQALVKSEKESGKVKASALGVLVRVAETEARLLGEIKSASSVVNNTMVVQNSDMAELRALIDQALAPFPVARSALLAALARSTQPQLENGIEH